MSSPNDHSGSADVKKNLKRLVAIIVTAVVLLLSLTLYLWEHSPKPP